LILIKQHAKPDDNVSGGPRTRPWRDVKKTLVTAFFTAALFTTIAVVRASAGVNTYVPSCDEFRGRLETADRMLGLRQIKPIRLSREPQESKGDDLWTMHDADGEEIINVTCRGGKFVGLEMIFPLPKPDDLGSTRRQFDYIAAGILGFTGWGTEKVIETATDVWKTKLRITSESKVKKAKTVENASIPGLCATISYSEFKVGDCR
jgi:hypothetical protein